MPMSLAPEPLEQPPFAPPPHSAGIGAGPGSVVPAMLRALLVSRAQRRQSEAARLGLESLEQAAPDSQAASRVGNPHTLQRADARADRLHDATCDRLSIDRSEKKWATRRYQVAVLGGEAAAGSNPCRSPPELGKVLGGAPPGRLTRRIDPLDPQAADAEQADERLALSGRPRDERRDRSSLRPGMSKTSQVARSRAATYSLRARATYTKV